MDLDTDAWDLLYKHQIIRVHMLPESVCINKYSFMGMLSGGWCDNQVQTRFSELAISRDTGQMTDGMVVGVSGEKRGKGCIAFV